MAVNEIYDRNSTGVCVATEKLNNTGTLKELLGHLKTETTGGHIATSMPETQEAVQGLAQTTARVQPLTASNA
jgi:hypothetical protein